MSLSTMITDAIWQRLQADDSMSAVLKGGTLFQFNSVTRILTQMEITPANCPVFAMAPSAKGHHWPRAKRRRGSAAELERRTTYELVMATAGEDSRDVVNLAESFEDFMARQFAADNFGLGQFLAEVEYSDLAFVPKANLQKHIELWQFTATMVCKFRIS